MSKLLTSEQVGKGHPDKIADQISDIVLNIILKENKNNKAAIETLINDQSIFINGEIITGYSDDELNKLIYKSVMDLMVNELNYKENEFNIIIHLTKQSQEINDAVAQDEQIGAGDQGIMFGYATNETKERLPIPYVLATKILKAIDNSDVHAPNYDSKSQVTYDYENNRVHTILVSVQHEPNIDIQNWEFNIRDIIMSVLENEGFDSWRVKILINPSGSFVKAGSKADVGLTGRKIIADTYGGFAKHGGGAFSGKDYTKVDRSAAYMLRYIANWVIEKGYAEKVEIQIAYAIGMSEPLSLNVNSFGTNLHGFTDDKIRNKILNIFNLTPRGIIDTLDLTNVDYTQTTTYGHFTNKKLPWENVK